MFAAGACVAISFDERASWVAQCGHERCVGSGGMMWLLHCSNASQGPGQSCLFSKIRWPPLEQPFAWAQWCTSLGASITLFPFPQKAIAAQVTPILEARPRLKMFLLSVCMPKSYLQYVRPAHYYPCQPSSQCFLGDQKVCMESWFIVQIIN